MPINPKSTEPAYLIPPLSAAERASAPTFVAWANMNLASASSRRTLANLRLASVAPSSARATMTVSPALMTTPIASSCIVAILSAIVIIILRLLVQQP